MRPIPQTTLHRTVREPLRFSLAGQKSGRLWIFSWRNLDPSCSFSSYCLLRIQDPAVFKESQLHQEFIDLEQTMRLLDMQLAEALQRIRHGSSAELIEKAKQDERTLLLELDRLMTRMRAIEGQLLQFQKTATRH